MTSHNMDAHRPRKLRAPNPAKPPADSPKGGCRILIADDEPAVLSSLKKALEYEGYEVRYAVNGAQALEPHLAARCDLAILDLTMPVKCGWDTFEELSRRDPLLPVIILTARHQQLHLAQSAGVGALLEKPVDIRELIHVIEDLLGEEDETRLRRLTGTGHTVYEPRSGDHACEEDR